MKLFKPRPPADPIPALGPPGLETTCLHKYVSLNPPMCNLFVVGAGKPRLFRKKVFLDFRLLGF